MSREKPALQKPKPARSAVLACFLLTFAAAAWAGNHVLARAVASSVPIWSLNVARWLIVAAIMLLVSGRQLRRDWPLIRQHPVALGFLGVIGGGLFGVLQFVGVRYTGALTLSVMNSVAPALIALASFLIFRDPTSLVQAIGITISLAGVLAIVCKLDPAILAALSFNPGDIIIVVNMALWAIYSACLRLRPSIAGTSFLFMLAVWSAITTLPGAIFEFLDGDVLKPDVLTLGTLAYSAVISSSIAYVFWGMGIETLGVNRAGAFLHLVPLFGTALATTLLGEKLGLHHIAGIALILVGVTLAVRQPKSKKRKKKKRLVTQDPQSPALHAARRG